MQQQIPFEWMKFIKTEGEKHLGIAIIRYERRFIFRFKIMPSEHGGYWATTASMKTGNTGGKDKYEPAFSLDSDYEKSQMMDFVLACVEQELSKQSNTSSSVFSSQANIQQAHHTGQQQKTQQQANYQASQTPHMTQQQKASNSQYTQASVFNDDNIPF